MARRQITSAQSRRTGHGREFTGLFFLFVSAFTFLSLLSFSPADPSFNQAVSEGWRVRNVAGVAGAYCAGFLVELFGFGAMFWPFYFLYLGLSRFVSRIRISKIRWLGLAGLFVAFEAWATHPWLVDLPADAYGLVGGGFFGREIVSRLTLTYLRPAGAFLLWVFISIISFQAFFGYSWASVWNRLLLWRAILQEKIDARMAQYRARKKARASEVKLGRDEIVGFDMVDEEDCDIHYIDLDDGDKNKRKEPQAAPQKPKPAKPVKTPGAVAPTGVNGLPSIELLTQPPPQATSQTQAVLQPLADRLKECLNDFNVQGEIQRVVPGPVVTMFEFKPAPGIKVSKIENLTDDIALALKAESVRIEAPIPGKDSVGIEIPNVDRQTVYLREVIESKEFTGSTSPLTLALGKDIHGATRVADLAKMPHLLVAGATGAGKSVGINGFLLSLLYKAGPDKVKLLLVDPKRIELAPYAALPHLVHPVVTEMSLAKSALDWAVFEMDCRYQKMAKLGVRNIEGYNKKLEDMGDTVPEEFEHMKHMPYLVIVIDELADLMMTAAKEVEQCIVRLAQLARAAGIHLVLATQRPSVDVVTGLIKANFPTRISFFVTSKFDSRTILDGVGAERLLGKGDMLFKPSGGKLTRMHGAYVDETEIAHVVNFWRDSQPQEFELDFTDWKKDAPGGDGSELVNESDDPVYGEAVQFVLSQGKASISLLQRRFRIGFNRAARYIEQMEMDGILGPQDGSKPRKVISPE
ncbi:MAG: DNA translocase FtsK 4TM domain-containing protein [Pseudodesulfovibrio sp.]|uniref:Cell division protein FtsK/SpoIIIE n=1 Tax=Pseudodesulfovibrio aespoeensis (strain ATCC 700646 / DSM 10631 / Aspo-2) TaxID=643562 RepID=E6VX76_PSEA9|nr:MULTISPECIES: DNA translocase FtsK [Pseudodesulfovibrio]MBU4377895.1 DNA translocase FtsK 4TM domain-containing protein [Pseudomonadota bacterium]ADU62582.1 cell division protein FtsK/SpoIIIE [Pseudodesulfovibrio aespoeensis Aspo-2]MBU4476186.1 DNA translocase FtsK 4TM domain-containing protein [Pseudomonadota bacterium]MBU4516519.1 DNA translocase FtsK 4TM domain-containing protein [Pseudomonadota bacterium]MBU4521540.1 DNA translocase FtsK 4TM domain-containing protein [Pseudomonadota bac